MTAKTYADQRVITPWSQEDEALMRITVASKLICNPILQKMLLELGNQPIVEDVSNRPNESGLFWGGYMTVHGLVGQNKLGNIWMEMCNLLARNQSCITTFSNSLNRYRNTVMNTITLPVTVELYGTP